MGHQAELDVAMISGELAPDGGAVSVGLAVEILVAVAAPNGAHVCHPKVIGPGAEGVEGRSDGVRVTCYKSEKPTPALLWVAHGGRLGNPAIRRTRAFQGIYYSRLVNHSGAVG